MRYEHIDDLLMGFPREGSFISCSISAPNRPDWDSLDDSVPGELRTPVWVLREGVFGVGVQSVQRVRPKKISAGERPIVPRQSR